MRIKSIKTKIAIIVMLFIAALLLAGCSTLDYVGEDYKPDNSQTIKTNEEFVFKTYKKSLDNVNIKAGISKTPIQEILVLYIGIENLSYETPYTFRVQDLKLYNSASEQHFISPENYLGIYEKSETQAMASMGIMGDTIANMTGLNANYNDYNQSIAQSNSQESSKSTIAKMEYIGNLISKHSIKYSSVISPRKSQYYYFFFEDLDSFPITVKYKTLSYQFKL